jgi:hypothetical protein
MRILDYSQGYVPNPGDVVPTLMCRPTASWFRKWTSMPSVSKRPANSARVAIAFFAYRTRCYRYQMTGHLLCLTSDQRSPCIEDESSTMNTVSTFAKSSSAFSISVGSQNQKRCAVGKLTNAAWTECLVIRRRRNIWIHAFDVSSRFG